MNEFANQNEMMYYRVPVLQSMDTCCYCQNELTELDGSYYFFCEDKIGIEHTKFHFCRSCGLGFKTPEELGFELQEISSAKNTECRVEQFPAAEINRAYSAKKNLRLGIYPKTFDEVLIKIYQGDYTNAVDGLEDLLNSQCNNAPNPSVLYQELLLLANLEDIIVFKRCLSNAKQWLVEEQIDALNKEYNESAGKIALTKKITIPSPPSSLDRSKARKKLQEWLSQFAQRVSAVKIENEKHRQQLLSTCHLLEKSKIALSSIKSEISQVLLDFTAFQGALIQSSNELHQNSSRISLLATDTDGDIESCSMLNEKAAFVHTQLINTAWSRAIFPCEWDAINDEIVSYLNEIKSLSESLSGRKSVILTLSTKLEELSRENNAKLTESHEKNDSTNRLLQNCTHAILDIDNLSEVIKAMGQNSDCVASQLQTLPESAQQEMKEVLLSPDLFQEKVNFFSDSLTKINNSLHQAIDEQQEIEQHALKLSNSISLFLNETEEARQYILSVKKEPLDCFASHQIECQEQQMLLQKKLSMQGEQVRELSKKAEALFKKIACIQIVDLSRFKPYLKKAKDFQELTDAGARIMLQRVILTRTEILNLEKDPQLGPIKWLSVSENLWEREYHGLVELLSKDLELTQPDSVLHFDMEKQLLLTSGISESFSHRAYFLKDGNLAQAFELCNFTENVPISPDDIIAILTPDYFSETIFGGAEALICLRFAWRK